MTSRSSSSAAVFLYLSTISFLPCVLSFSSLQGFRLRKEESLREITRRRCCPERVQEAKSLLLWEVVEEREAQPVLNLSNRNDVMIVNSQPENPLDDSWQNGQQWAATKARLQHMADISSEEADKLLEAVPQLLRINTEVIVDSLSAVMHLIGSDCILKEPRLLSFRGDDLRYGAEFLFTMMASPPSTVLQACRVSPSLLLAGAEGGLQEQAVKRALGAAGQAAERANTVIAGDTAVSLQALRRQKPPGL
jgi:hypothetical protein